MMLNDIKMILNDHNQTTKSIQILNVYNNYNDKQPRQSRPAIKTLNLITYGKFHSYNT